MSMITLQNKKELQELIKSYKIRGYITEEENADLLGLLESDLSSNDMQHQLGEFFKARHTEIKLAVTSAAQLVPKQDIEQILLAHGPDFLISALYNSWETMKKLMS